MRGMHLDVPPSVRGIIDDPDKPLWIGDVGTGKSALAESFGDDIARTIDIPVFLYRLSLASRGSGAVGTTGDVRRTPRTRVADGLLPVLLRTARLLASAFAEVRKAMGRHRSQPRCVPVFRLGRDGQGQRATGSGCCCCATSALRLAQVQSARLAASIIRAVPTPRESGDTPEAVVDALKVSVAQQEGGFLGVVLYLKAALPIKRTAGNDAVRHGHVERRPRLLLGRSGARPRRE